MGDMFERVISNSARWCCISRYILSCPESVEKNTYEKHDVRNNEKHPSASRRAPETAFRTSPAARSIAASGFPVIAGHAVVGGEYALRPPSSTSPRRSRRWRRGSLHPSRACPGGRSIGHRRRLLAAVDDHFRRRGAGRLWVWIQLFEVEIFIAYADLIEWIAGYGCLCVHCDDAVGRRRWWRQCADFGGCRSRRRSTWHGRCICCCCCCCCCETCFVRQLLVAYDDDEWSLVEVAVNWWDCCSKDVRSCLVCWSHRVYVDRSNVMLWNRTSIIAFNDTVKR